MRRRLVIVNFAKYHPANREVTSSARGNGKLRWVRLETDWHHDAVVMALPPEERALWPILLAEGGKGHPHGTIDLTMTELADAARLPEESVRHAIAHLRRRERVTFVTEGVTEP